MATGLAAKPFRQNQELVDIAAEGPPTAPELCLSCDGFNRYRAGVAMPGAVPCLTSSYRSDGRLQPGSKPFGGPPRAP